MAKPDLATTKINLRASPNKKLSLTGPLRASGRVVPSLSLKRHEKLQSRRYLIDVSICLMTNGSRYSWLPLQNLWNPRLLFARP